MKMVAARIAGRLLFEWVQFWGF